MEKLNMFSLKNSDKKCVMSSMTLRKINKELVEKKDSALHEKTWILPHQHLRKSKMCFSLFLFSRLFSLEYIVTFSISLIQ